MLFKILKRRKAWKETKDVVPKGHSVGVKAILVPICTTPNVMKHLGKVANDVSVWGQFIMQMIWTFVINMGMGFRNAPLETDSHQNSGFWSF